MSDSEYTDEEIEFLKEQCEFISNEYEKLMANLLKMPPKLPQMKKPLIIPMAH